MYDEILIPTDGSDGVRKAIRHALALADTTGARLHALSVVEEHPTFPGILSGDDLEARATEAVDDVVEMAERAGVEVVRDVRTGHPDEAILAYADEHDVDMVVMGTHGRRGVDRVVLGSTAERVVRRAEIPVVTVRLTVHVEDEGHAAEIAERAVEAETGEAVTVIGDVAREYRWAHRLPTWDAWVVPVRTEDGAYEVHVDVETADTRLEPE